MQGQAQPPATATADGGKRPRAFLATEPPGPADRWAARNVAIVAVLLCLLSAPFARIDLPQAPAFIPAYESALLTVNLITAILLCSQARMTGSLAVAVLGAGYLFAAAMNVPHALTFPGLVAPEGLFGVGPQVSAWVLTLRYVGFSGAVIVYAGLRRADRGSQERARRLDYRWLVLTPLLAATLCTALPAWFADSAPLIEQGAYTWLAARIVTPALLGLVLVAFALAAQARTRSVLDLWLTTMLFVGLLSIALAVLASERRFDLGFYAARIYGLISNSLVLAALLLESIRLSARLVGALEIAEARNAELESSREQLARAQRLEAVGQLTGGIAHDFNNLLTVVSGNLELILRDPQNTGRVQRLADSALGAVERGARLTQQLLTFARRQISRPETVNLNRLLTELEPLLRRAAGEEIAVELMLSPVLDPARIDPGQFEAAILNLVVNARDAISGSGRIGIETRNVAIEHAQAMSADTVAPGAYVSVAVRDTGAGMPEEVRVRAFEPFFTTKEVGKGSGLGLSQVYGFAQGSGGEVRIQSRVGQGATVTMLLPRSVERPVAVPSPRRAPRPEPANEGQGTILIVEDDPSVRSVATEALAELGYRVLAAANAGEALTILRSETKVDLLFSDVVMPGGMNGAELADEAKRLRPGLKVLLTSGYALAALSAEHGLPPDLEVIGKPYGREDLVIRLKRALGGAA